MDKTSNLTAFSEIFQADADYESGTVVIFGGESEITVTSGLADVRVAGVICPELGSNKSGIAVVLKGKVQLNAMGPVNKGDPLITSDHYGRARSLKSVTDLISSMGSDGYNSVFAKSLEDNPNTGPITIWAVVI